MKRSDIPEKYLNKFYHPTKIDEIVEETIEEIFTDDRNYLISEIEAECSKPDFDLWTIAYAQDSMPRFNKQYFIDKDVAHKWAIYWMWQNYFEGIVAEPLTVRAIGENQWKNLDIENLIYGDPPYTFNYPLGPSEIESRNNYLKYFYEEQLLDFYDEHLLEGDDPGEIEEADLKHCYPRYE